VDFKGVSEVADENTESLSEKDLRGASAPMARMQKTSWQEFGPFVSEGFVSLPGESTKWRPIRILRDTGAAQSLILEGVLPLSASTETGDCALIHGIGQGVNRVTLHHIDIKSDLVSGPVIVGVQSEFPVEGISLLLGNDLADIKVFANLHSTPFSNQRTPLDDDLEVNTVGAVTRAMSSKTYQEPTSVGKRDDTEVELADTFLASLYQRQDEGGKPTKEYLIEEQTKDVELSELRENAQPLEETEPGPCVYYLKDGMLMRRWRPPEASVDEEWRVLHQIVVPTKFRRDILTLAHDTPLSGHLGVKKTYQRIASHFFWPQLRKDVAEYCRTCHTCQLIGKPNQTIPPAPLHPVPAFEEPFSRIIIDCVGPLPKTKSGHQYLLTIMCAATRFPEAVPLRKIKTPNIVKALIKFFTVFGLPREVQSDQGTNFTARLFKQVMKQLGVKQCMSSAYHPESQGALERFHQTLKNMIRTYCYDNERDWDEGIPMLLFASREAVQESLGFSPFELEFGHTV
jgi:Integrase zinc binding domain/Integrase core domain